MNDDILHFESDYMEGAHPRILEQLVSTNFEKTTGYGTDRYCESAREKIRAACGSPDAAVFFLSGGTQTNATVIAGILRTWQGVLAADTGHISIHEAGAIEATGHKVITLPHKDGKLAADTVARYMETFTSDANNAHMVEPGLVYISHPTEYGTLYTKSELEDLHTVCQKYRLPVFLDGARLGYGLAALNTDVTLNTIATICDVFYIGGTKVGALFGEAVVIPHPETIPHFFTVIKQHGALLAKGRILGIQFETLFTDNLYYRIARNAIDTAMHLKRGLKEKNIEFYIDSPTNQQFIILENNRIKELSAHIGFGYWEKYNNTHTVMRLATSWATKDESIDQLLSLF